MTDKTFHRMINYQQTRQSILIYATSPLYYNNEKKTLRSLYRYSTSTIIIIVYEL